ncbi:MAG: 30S ribosomal protein S20 [Flavobacteriaceae bacterium]
MRPPLDFVAAPGRRAGARNLKVKGSPAMPNTSSAKKMVRKIAARTEVNKARRTRMRGFIRKVEEALASGERSAAEAALRAAEPEIMRAAQKGIIHRSTASRKVSRLSARVKALPA